MALVYLTRIEHFNAAHRLFNPAWDKDKNLQVFGKCYSPNFHGHNYELHTTVCGKPNPETGFVFNAKELSRIIEDNVIEIFDHRNLNLDVPHFKDKFSSAENLIILIWEILDPILQKENIKLFELKLHETPTIYVTYKGE